MTILCASHASALATDTCSVPCRVVSPTRLPPHATRITGHETRVATEDHRHRIVRALNQTVGRPHNFALATFYAEVR